MLKKSLEAIKVINGYYHEENQYLNVPVERLAELSPEIKQIAGFDMYRALGFYDPSVS